MDILEYAPPGSGLVPVSFATSLESSARAGVSLFGAGFIARALLVAILVTLSHQFQWEWLRFLTSEVVLAHLCISGHGDATAFVRNHPCARRGLLLCDFMYIRRCFRGNDPTRLEPQEIDV